MKLFKGIIVSAMAIVMLIPSFAFADDGPFIKDLSKLRAKPNGNFMMRMAMNRQKSYSC